MLGALQDALCAARFLKFPFSCQSLIVLLTYNRCFCHIFLPNSHYFQHFSHEFSFISNQKQKIPNFFPQRNSKKVPEAHETGKTGIIHPFDKL